MDRTHRILCAIVLLGLALRVAVTLAWPERLTEDVDGYRAIAEQILAGSGFSNAVTGEPTAFRPPLYPLLLAALLFTGGGTVAIATVQIACGTLTVALSGIAARRAGLRCPWLAALLVAIDPLSLAYTPRVMTEVLCGLLIAALLCVATAVPAPDRRGLRSAGFGLLFGLATLCRPTLWAVVPILGAFAGAAAIRRQLTGRTLIRTALPAIAVATIVVAPWLVRNFLTLGAPILTTTHGGYTLLLGNNPQFYDTVAHRRWDVVWDSRGWQDQLAQEAAEAGIRPTDEVGRDRWMYDRAWRNIRTDPHGFARSCVVRLLRFWSLIPLTDSPAPGVTLAVGLLHALIFIGLAASLFRSRRPAALQLVWTLAWAMLIAFSTVHLLYWSNARMRAPLVAAIALLSALGWAGSRTHTRTESTE